MFSQMEQRFVTAGNVVPRHPSTIDPPPLPDKGGVPDGRGFQARGERAFTSS
jgi:hypothetical protein